MRRLSVAVAAVLAVSTQLATPPRAAAEPGLQPGACVRVDKLYNGVVIRPMPENNNAYLIKDNKNGPDYIASERTTVAAPCEGAASPSISGAPVRAEEARAPQQPQPPKLAQAAQPARPAGACFASDPDGRGATAQERAFRSIIRRQLEGASALAADGAITVRFQTFAISAGRPADIIDQVSYKPDLSKPIYSVRTQFETCADYRTATTTKQMERNFHCFTNSTGGQNCSVSGSTAGMRRDTSQYAPK